MTKDKEVLKEWELLTNKLADVFVQKYYGEGLEAGHEYYWENDIGSVIEVNYCYFSLNRIIDAIRFNVTPDQLWDYKDLELEYHDSEKKPDYVLPNFENYIKYGLELFIKKDWKDQAQEMFSSHWKKPLSRLCGVNEKTVANWANDVHKIKQKYIDKINKVYQIWSDK